MVYYLNIFVEIFLGICLLGGYTINGDLKNERLLHTQKEIYCGICGILWILISGLRGISVGADTLAYKQFFENVKGISLNSLLQIFKDKYLYHKDIKDPGYNLFVKLFQSFSQDYQLFLIFVAVIFMLPFTIWIIRESRNPLISFILYSSLFYAFFSITGIRQTISTALVVLIGDRLIKEKKLIPFVIITLLASTIHASALVFLPFYFISRIKVDKITLSMWTVLILLSFIFKNQIKSFFVGISGYDDYSKNYEGAGTYTFTFLLLLILILSFVAYKKDLNLEQNKRLYNALFLATFFVPLTWLEPSAMRVVQYYSIYLVLLIPELIESVFDKKSQIIVSGFITVLLVFLIFKSDPQYSFYWQ